MQNAPIRALLTFIELPFVIKIFVCLFLRGRFTQVLLYIAKGTVAWYHANMNLYALYQNIRCGALNEPSLRDVIYVAITNMFARKKEKQEGGQSMGAISNIRIL